MRPFPKYGAIAAFVVLLGVGPAAAQNVTVDFGEEGSLSLQVAQLFVLITVLSLAPGILMMATCFPFMVTVLSILRQAIGVQQAPPNMMIVSLALFLTYFVMAPVFETAWENGVEPFSSGEIPAETALERTVAPFRAFMENRTAPETIEALREARRAGPAIPAETSAEDGASVVDPPLSLLAPAFMLSEIKRGFEIGFLVFLPFLVIDLVVASILMSMGMMMVPPAIVSLPFKLAFFVLADGWTLLAGALVRGYGA